MIALFLLESTSSLLGFLHPPEPLLGTCDDPSNSSGLASFGFFHHRSRRVNVKSSSESSPSEWKQTSLKWSTKRCEPQALSSLTSSSTFRASTSATLNSSLSLLILLEAQSLCLLCASYLGSTHPATHPCTHCSLPHLPPVLTQMSPVRIVIIIDPHPQDPLLFIFLLPSDFFHEVKECRIVSKSSHLVLGALFFLPFHGHYAKLWGLTLSSFPWKSSSKSRATGQN